MLNCLYYKRGCGNPKMTVQTETCGKNKSTMYFANFITQQVTTWFTPISVLPNVLLSKSGINEKLNEVLPDSICKTLDVDIVIKSSWSYSKTGSEGAAIATAVLWGFAKSTASGQLTMQIYEAKTGEMIWRMSKEMNEGTFSS